MPKFVCCAFTKNNRGTTNAVLNQREEHILDDSKRQKRFALTKNQPIQNEPYSAEDETSEKTITKPKTDL
jgi:hypothetical protein